MWALGLMLWVALGSAWAADPGNGSNPHAKWEQDIRAFERRDATNPPPQGAILFIGSSSIRMWEALEKDFAGLRVINRGFGDPRLRTRRTLRSGSFSPTARVRS